MRSCLIALLTACCLPHAAVLAADATAHANLQPARDLQNFLKVARKADRFEDILPFLPKATQEEFRSSEKAFDKEAIKGIVQESDLFRDAAELLSRTPYEKGLDRYKAMADKIRKYVSTEVRGDEATIHVETRVNGEWDPAEVRMVREGSSWRFDDLQVDIHF